MRTRRWMGQMRIATCSPPAPLIQQQLQALASLRGKTSEQKVSVEHVHVQEGGQAVVGSLTRIGDAPPGEGNACCVRFCARCVAA
jgi:hypothetical protein